MKSHMHMAASLPLGLLVILACRAASDSLASTQDNEILCYCAVFALDTTGMEEST